MYCHEDNIALERCPQVVFFPLMVILEGGVRFPMDPLLLMLGSKTIGTNVLELQFVLCWQTMIKT